MKIHSIFLLIFIIVSCKSADEPQIEEDAKVSKFIFINNSDVIINKINFRTWIYFPIENSTRYMNNWGYEMKYGDSLTIEIKDRMLYKDCIYQNMISWEEKDFKNDILIHEYISILDTLDEIVPKNIVINWPSDSINFEKVL